MKSVLNLLKNELITGMVLLAPVLGTLYLIYFIVRSIDDLFPDMWRPEIRRHPLPGLGIVSVICIALLVGIFAHNVVGRRMMTLFDSVVSRLPLFGGTYGLIKQVFESVFSQGADSFQKAVLVEYPHPGSHAIGFVTSTRGPKILSKDGKPLVQLYVPTTPNPTSGFYLLVEKELVRELDMPVDQAFKLVITMGIAREPEMMTSSAKVVREEAKGDPAK